MQRCVFNHALFVNGSLLVINDLFVIFGINSIEILTMSKAIKYVN